MSGMRGEVLEDASYGILRKERSKRALYHVRSKERSEDL